MNTSTGQVGQGIDIQQVSMRPFSRLEAQAYAEEFKPFDCAGSYRLEDQNLMAAGSEFVIDVQGEDPSGVLGCWGARLLGCSAAEVLGCWAARLLEGDQRPHQLVSSCA